MPTVRCVIDRIEEKIAVLKTDEGEVTLPHALLPDGVGEGTVLYVRVAPAPDETKEKKAQAKELLNALLKGA